MMNQLVERMRGTAIFLNLGHLIDEFLDRLDELRVAMALAEINSLARNEARTTALLY